MIQSKRDLQEYLDADKKSLGRKKRRPGGLDYIWRYEIYLRKCEFYYNVKKGGLRYLMYRFLMTRLGAKCHFSIPLNVVGKGLALVHIGPVIISKYARIGEYCRIHVGVNIGADARIPEAAPQVGNRVYFGPGAKAFGAIEIADSTAIGANTVVTKSFTDGNCSIAGVPARVISPKGTEGIIANI